MCVRTFGFTAGLASLTSLHLDVTAVVVDGVAPAQPVAGAAPQAANAHQPHLLQRQQTNCFPDPAMEGPLGRLAGLSALTSLSVAKPWRRSRDLHLPVEPLLVGSMAAWPGLASLTLELDGRDYLPVRQEPRVLLTRIFPVAARPSGSRL